ncbi:putative mediator of RNA polymerase II transcription subunit 26 isoform X1 [Lucilia cuprina]|uniref:putative mediator of RNA polymerase II transcription subunit 26 isoform X1 n=1 Tax=Lucilia cuprina TaxID=7375 RepID=UPI001F065D48|nr:putative mediator of RNA polymerase II transcription subunit 26 isoform X1 [Lucilia cuprina]
MHFNYFLLVSLACFIGYSQTADTTSVTASATTAKPQGFQSRSIVAADEDDAGDDVFETQAQTHLAYRQQQQHYLQQQQQQHHQQQQQQQPLYDYSQSEEDQEEPPRQQYQTRKQQQQQQQNYQSARANSKQKQSSEEETEEEEEEPDRLSLLLAQSKFACNGKTTGYYADDTLNCEVFHYCQENQRHSWICPEGFTFHQIHLICMPPSNDNICQQSSKYHIVNEYLYKPVNLQEHQSKPNVTLRYSERYYPESYYDNDRYEDEEEAPRPRVQHHRQPLQVGFHQQQQPQYQRAQSVPQQQQVRHQSVQQQQISQPQQTTVYRKPLPVTTIQPQIQPQIQQIRNQAPPPTVTPSPYRFFTAAPQLQHLQQNQQQVYRTPEEINISLQQRRPQIFIASTTPRYYEDEYLYERK